MLKEGVQHRFSETDFESNKFSFSFSFDGTLSLNLPPNSFSFKSLFFSRLPTSRISLPFSPTNFRQSSLSRCEIGI
ncbi:hypothetical protein GLYMA_01G199300v4 [Glycine max]|uniref:Uncharacterized protein n=1 Tax=Glycine max TaxID=3847 RepID=K7K4U2_SOYBN|nr:hypothetical protein JHK85_002404 [Glycine max]KAG5089731.1 hypothetical protein JHK86_002343 [Glycine max]KAH1163988.1 hypothetical protein GYH30_002161 [Glycine max]KRH77214.1 hypothetical protein GLYMA_01G199300v4 [Glycine max]